MSHKGRWKDLPPEKRKEEGSLTPRIPDMCAARFTSHLPVAGVTTIVSLTAISPPVKPLRGIHRDKLPLRGAAE